MAVNIQEIKDAFLAAFSYTGDVSIDPATGLIKCTGRAHLDDLVPELPVAFSRVLQDFDVAISEVRSLKGCPEYVGRDFYCNKNLITSLEGGPRKVVNAYVAKDNHLTSLKGIPRWVGTNFYLTVHEDTPLLDLLLMEKCGKLVLLKPDTMDEPIEDLQELITRYIGTGYDGMVPCAARMAKMGYASNARMG